MRTILAFILSAHVSWGALDFSAANSHGIATVSSFSTVPMTMSAWVYRTTTTADTAMGVGNDGTQITTIYGSTSERWGFAHQGSSGAIISPFVTKDSSYRNRWMHMVFVAYSDTDRRIFLDGVQELANTDNRPSGTVTRVYISGRVYSGVNADFWKGGLAHVAVWSSALTSAEIASLAAGVAPNKIRPANLVFYAPLSNIGPGGGSGTAINLVGPVVNLTNTVTQATTQPRIYR